MSCTYFKIEANGMLLPEIYFNYDQAKAALRNLENNNVHDYSNLYILNQLLGVVIYLYYDLH